MPNPHGSKSAALMLSIVLASVYLGASGAKAQIAPICFNGSKTQAWGSSAAMITHARMKSSRMSDAALRTHFDGRIRANRMRTTR